MPAGEYKPFTIAGALDSKTKACAAQNSAFKIGSLLISEKGTLAVHFRENFRPLQCSMIRAFEFDSNVLNALDLDKAPFICHKSKFMRII